MGDIQTPTRLLCCKTCTSLSAFQTPQKCQLKKPLCHTTHDAHCTGKEFTQTHTFYIRIRMYEELFQQRPKKEKLYFNHKYPAHLWDWSIKACNYVTRLFQPQCRHPPLSPALCTLTLWWGDALLTRYWEPYDNFPCDILIFNLKLKFARVRSTFVERVLYRLRYSVKEPCVWFFSRGVSKRFIYVSVPVCYR